MESNQVPSCTYIPKQITYEKLKELILFKWVTNYKSQHVVVATFASQVSSIEPSLKEKKRAKQRYVLNRPNS